MTTTRRKTIPPTTTPVMVRCRLSVPVRTYRASLRRCAPPPDWTPDEQAWWESYWDQEERKETGR